MLKRNWGKCWEFSGVAGAVLEFKWGCGADEGLVSFVLHRSGIVWRFEAEWI